MVFALNSYNALLMCSASCCRVCVTNIVFGLHNHKGREVQSEGDCTLLIKCNIKLFRYLMARLQTDPHTRKVHIFISTPMGSLSAPFMERKSTSASSCTRKGLSVTLLVAPQSKSSSIGSFPSIVVKRLVGSLSH